MDDENEIKAERRDRVNDVLRKYLYADWNEDKYYLCLVACIMAKDHDHFFLDVEEVAARHLSSVFIDEHLYKVWRIIDTTSQIGILYDLFCLLASCSAPKVKVDAGKALKRLLLFDIRRESAGETNFIPLLILIKDFEQGRNEFIGAIQKWYEGEVSLKIDAIMEGVNILISLMKEEQTTTADGACRLVAYFILYNEFQDIPLLTYLIDRLSTPFFFLGGNHMWQWIERFVHHIQTCQVGCEIMQCLQEGVTREMLLASFNSYSANNKLIVCAFLLKLTMLSTKPQHSTEVNTIMFHIDKSNKGARIWGEGGTLMERLMLILKQHRRVQAKEAILQFYLYMSENMLVDSGGGAYMDEFILLDFADYFVNGESLVMQILSGRILVLYLNFNHFQHLILNMMSYHFFNQLRNVLDLFNPPQEELKAIRDTIRDLIG